MKKISIKESNIFKVLSDISNVGIFEDWKDKDSIYLSVMGDCIREDYVTHHIYLNRFKLTEKGEEKLTMIRRELALNEII